MSEWQPIETAPKDGTRILIVDADGEIEITEWYETMHDVYEYVHNGLYRKHTETYYAGWNGNGHRATHWMPLPPAPASCDGSREAGETERLDPKDDSAVPEGQTPSPSDPVGAKE